MDLEVFTFNASIQPHLFWDGPISWIGGLQGALRGLVTQNLFVELSSLIHISRHELDHWTDSQWILNLSPPLHPTMV